MPATPVVYIDVVFLVNFVLDAMLLWTTAWILKRKLRISRIVLGGLVGAVYALVMFVPLLSLLTTWWGKALASVVMVYVAIPRKSLLDMVRLLSMFYCVSFIFAGAAVALGYAIPGTSISHSIALGNGGLIFQTSSETLALMVAIPLAVYALQRLMASMKRGMQKVDFLCEVTAYFGSQSISFTGIIDSGNGLYDPVSTRPVSFVDVDVLCPVLPKELRVAVKQGKDLLTSIAQLATTASFTLVPFQGASGRGLTIAIRPDKVVLRSNRRTWTCHDKHLFAVFPGSLSSDDAFHAILHMDIMNGDDEDEDTTSAAGAQASESKTTDSTEASLHTSPR